MAQSDKGVLKVVRISKNAYLPTKGSKLAAGYDLQSAYDYVIPAEDKMLVKTDLQITVPPGTYGRIAPRSGLAVKHFINIGAGVVDEDYTGNVGIVVFNHAKTAFKVCRGDRIAQLICELIIQPELVECKSLDITDRGDNGFGSSGIK